MKKSQRSLSQGPLLPIVHGATGLFLGIGLARFSFSPVIPLLVRDEWYSASQAQMLGAWGLAGYLLGCFTAQRLARLFTPNLLAGILAVLVVLSFWICSYPVSYPVAALWRLIAGAAGAVLMITCVAEASGRLGAIGHGNKAGILFTGVGAGAVVAATLMPSLSNEPVENVSSVLTLIAAAGFALQLVSGFLMPKQGVGTKHVPVARSSSGREKAIFWVMLAYGLDALGGTPIVVYFVDYASREVGVSALWSGIAWGAFGLGAIIGPLIMMRCASRWLIISFLLKAGALSVLGLTSWPPAYVLICFVAGFYTPGVAVQVANFMYEAVSEPPGFLRYWAWATTSFALMQAASGFAASQLNQIFSSYRPVYWMCAAVLFAGVFCCWQGRRALAEAIAQEKLQVSNT